MIRRRRPLPRGTSPKRKAYLPRATKPIPKVNPVRMARRVKAYKAFLASPAWRAQRKRVLERDGYRCVRVEGGERCGYTKADGPLIANHRRYSPHGLERTPDSDIETLCPHHNARYESAKPTRRPIQEHR